MIGRIFLGRYEAVRLLGEGGMGKVYLARQLDLGRQVVIKIMHDHLAADPTFCERFQRKGGAMVFADDALVMHWHDLNLRRFARQHFNYGRGADFLHRSRWRATQLSGIDTPRWRPRLERPSFYVNLILYPLRRERGLRGLHLASLVSLSQAAYASGYLFQRIKGPPPAG